MRKTIHFSLDHPEDFRLKLMEWSKSFSQSCLLNNNGFTSQNRLLDVDENHHAFDWLQGVGVIDELRPNQKVNVFEQLMSFSDRHSDWILGYLSYDVKNEIEDLHSCNEDGLDMPEYHFFVPRYLFTCKSEQLTIEYREEIDSEASVKRAYNQIIAQHISNSGQKKVIGLKPRIKKEAYIQKVVDLQSHIQKGDIYEVNFCQEFYAEQADIIPVELYHKLNKKSPAPFSAYYRDSNFHLMCASPERYLKKVGDKVYSQPIKGTSRRGVNLEEDELIKKQLYHDPKERSENVMIVDLVRNDLSKSSVRNSVEVNELFGVYTFPQVHQLISTVSSKLREDVHFVNVIKDTFPMGSMTGAPKVRAMKFIEKFEATKRGLFSGTVGYISPKKDFDFNVVIRSILFNSLNSYLSFIVGGAITSNSIPDKEYEESILKAKAMFSVLDNANE